MVVPQGIESINGSATNMGCNSSLTETDGRLSCRSRNYLVDGCSPRIDPSTSVWASQLVTVRRSEGNADISFPHVLLTFNFDRAVSLTGIEFDMFLCPKWGIGAESVTVYLDQDVESLSVFNLPFVFSDGPNQLSCDSLSTMTITGGSFSGAFYQTIYILVAIVSSPGIEWVHFGDVRFLGHNFTAQSSCVSPPSTTPDSEN